jgi:hypothetical protein
MVVDVLSDLTGFRKNGRKPSGYSLESYVRARAKTAIVIRMRPVFRGRVVISNRVIVMGDPASQRAC